MQAKRFIFFNLAVQRKHVMLTKTANITIFQISKNIVH